MLEYVSIAGLGINHKKLCMEHERTFFERYLLLIKLRKLDYQKISQQSVHVGCIIPAWLLIINGQLMHHYNTQWRGLAKLLISVIRQCEGQMSGVSGKSFPTSFSFHTICLVLMLKQGKWYANIKYMDYTFEPFDGELLSGSDLLFFYYDVFGRNESSIANSYEWDDDIKTFLSHQKTTIEICDITQIPNNFEDNTLLFTCNKNESKSNALLRHLRNAFAHMRIQRYGDCYLLKDIGRLQKNTMLGKIKCECLKHVVYLLIKQGECFIENNENR